MRNILFTIIALIYTIITCAQGDSIQILPQNPSINDSVIVVISKCNYDITSFSVTDDTITIITATNSQIMAPCILTYDTVNIGKFPSGTEYITYFYVDEASSTEDSILYTKTLEINISDLTNNSTNPEYLRWKIFPNPANNVISVESNKSDYYIDHIVLTIIDLQGKIILEKFTGNKIETIDISNLQKGIYVMQLLDSGNHTSFYFIKK